MYSVVVDCEDNCDAWQWAAEDGWIYPHGYLPGRVQVVYVVIILTYTG